MVAIGHDTEVPWKCQDRVRCTSLALNAPTGGSGLAVDRCARLRAGDKLLPLLRFLFVERVDWRLRLIRAIVSTHWPHQKRWAAAAVRCATKISSIRLRVEL